MSALSAGEWGSLPTVHGQVIPMIDKTSIPVAALPDAWCYRVSARTGFPLADLLVGLVIRHPPQELKIPGLNPACAGIFSGSNHTSDLKISTPVATLPGTWHYRVSTGTGQPGVSILWLSEMESLVCNFSFSVAARKNVWADPSLRYTSMLLGC